VAREAWGKKWWVPTWACRQKRATGTGAAWAPGGHSRHLEHPVVEHKLVRLPVQHWAVLRAPPQLQPASPNVQDLKISRFQDFKISRFQDFKMAFESQRIVFF